MSKVVMAAVHQEDDWYIAQALEVDVASQGRSVDEALANLAEAVELYIDEADAANTTLIASYVIIVERADDGGYGAWCPELPGVIALADTEAEVIIEMKQAMAIHVEGLREDGLLPRG
jgi:predicted RNase H-like HicB family nuclease